MYFILNYITDIRLHVKLYNIIIVVFTYSVTDNIKLLQFYQHQHIIYYFVSY